MFTSRCPVRSAEALDDESLDKMLSKASEYLTMALMINGKIVDKNQTSLVYSDFASWTSKNYKNFMWMIDFFMSIRDERKLRFPEIEDPKEWPLLSSHVHFKLKIPRPRETLDEFPNVTDYPEANVISCYRKLLEDTWNHMEEIPTWTMRGPPIWSWRHPNNIDKLDNKSYNTLEV